MTANGRHGACVLKRKHLNNCRTKIDNSNPVEILSFLHIYTNIILSIDVGIPIPTRPHIQICFAKKNDIKLLQTRNVLCIKSDARGGKR